MSIETKIEYRALDINDDVRGRGNTIGEALRNMEEVLGEPLYDAETPDGIEWYVMEFRMERAEGEYEYEDVTAGEKVSQSW